MASIRLRYPVKAAIGPDSKLISSLHTAAPSRTAKDVPAKLIKTTPCKWFNSSTGCDQGDACTFKHVQVIPTEQQRAVPRPWRTQPCRHFQVGRCHHGDACHFAHVIATVPPRSPGASASGSQLSWSESQASSRKTHSLASSQASQNSLTWPDSPESVPKSEPLPPMSPVEAHTPVMAAGEKGMALRAADSVLSSSAPHAPASPVYRRRASAPPTLPESPLRFPFASDAPHSSDDTPHGNGELCADWLASGRCQREGCTFAHCPATPLTEEHLSKACAQLRLMKRYDDDTDSEDDDDDDVEFVTVATQSTQSPTMRSARSISTSSL